MKLFAALASLAAAAQYQGTNSDGTEWSASVTDDNFAFQENGESLVAEGSEPSDAGVELHSVCSPALGGCVTKYTEYSSHTYDGSSITAEGEDGYGAFVMTGTVADGKTKLVKKYTIGLQFNMEVDGVPNSTGTFLFGPFTYTANTGDKGTGRVATAFVDSVQTTFDSSSARRQ